MKTPCVTTDHGGIDETPASPAPQNTSLAEATALGLCRELGLETELAQAVAPVLIQNLITLEKKQRDYGPHNLTKFGSFGVVVRMNDKMERITNLMNKRQANSAERMAGRMCSPNSVYNEPMSDSFLDLANYAMIAYVMQQNLWPNESR